MSEMKLDQRAWMLVNQIAQAFDMAPRGHSPTVAQFYEYAERIALQHMSEAIAALHVGGEGDLSALDREELELVVRCQAERIEQLQSAPVAVTWQPIASAPKDGTPIAFRNRGTTIGACRWWTAEQLAEDEAGSPEEYSGGWYNADDKDDEVCPTEWMPLPSAALAAEVG